MLLESVSRLKSFTELSFVCTRWRHVWRQPPDNMPGLKKYCI